VLGEEEAPYISHTEHATTGPYDSSASFIVPYHLLVKNEYN
jgi:hypothetical protein